jgi:hypothetical protein
MEREPIVMRQTRRPAEAVELDAAGPVDLPTGGPAIAVGVTPRHWDVLVLVTLLVTANDEEL